MYDIRSVWIVRPTRIFDARNAKEFNGVHVDCCIWPDGSEKWAIRSGEQLALGKDGEWIHEPQPSSRDDEFYAMYRFDSLEEAVGFATLKA